MGATKKVFFNPYLRSQQVQETRLQLKSVVFKFDISQKLSYKLKDIAKQYVLGILDMYWLLTLKTIVVQRV